MRQRLSRCLIQAVHGLESEGRIKTISDMKMTFPYHSVLSRRKLLVKQS